MPGQRSQRTILGIAAEDEEERDESSRTRRVWKIVPPLVVLFAAVGLVLILRATAPTPERAEPGPPGVLVDVHTATPFTGRPEVRVQGTVVAARQTRIAAEVPGRVEWMSERLTAGGRFVEGEPMLRVDPTDYRLAVKAQRGAVAQAETTVRQERAERHVNMRAWEVLREDRTLPPEAYTEEGRALALNEPQLEAAQEELVAARSRLQQARVDLERTTLRAPFAAKVEEESVDLGQQVTRAEPIATLTGTERYHVQASVPVQQVAYIRIGDAARGAPARVTQTLRGRELVWEGHVEQLLPAVEERGSMARVVVVIPDPLGLERPEGPRDVPLLLGSFVDVSIEAEPLPESVVEVPRAALREDRQVWVATEDGRLEIREVDVVWRREETVLLASGVRAGERVIVSPIPAPVDGMPVRIAPSEPTAPLREPEASLP